MAWCEECGKYLTPSSLNADGTCPSCGKQVGDPEAAAEATAARREAAERAGTDVEPADDESTPWHFKLLVVMLVVYLGWRFVQLLT